MLEKMVAEWFLKADAQIIAPVVTCAGLNPSTFQHGKKEGS